MYWRTNRTTRTNTIYWHDTSAASDSYRLLAYYSLFSAPDSNLLVSYSSLIIIDHQFVTLQLLVYCTIMPLKSSWLLSLVVSSLFIHSYTPYSAMVLSCQVPGQLKMHIYRFWHQVRTQRHCWRGCCLSSHWSTISIWPNLLVFAIVLWVQARSSPRCRKKRDKIKNSITPKSFIAHSDIIVLYSCTIYTPQHTTTQHNTPKTKPTMTMILFPQAWVWTNRRVIDNVIIIAKILTE